MANRGFTLLIAMIITATLLLVSTGVVSVAVKEAFLSSAARESQHAFYAADTGIECALYWDLRGIGGVSAFSASSSSATISCAGDSAIEPDEDDGLSTFNFDFEATGEPYCALVTVEKGALTTIRARGYNTCDASNPRRVERGVSVSY